jgi:hypothetical protein
MYILLLLCMRNIFFLSSSLPILSSFHLLADYLSYTYGSSARAYTIFLVCTHIGTKVRKTDRRVRKKRRTRLAVFFLLQPPFNVCTCVCIVQLFLFFFIVFFFLIVVVHCRFFFFWYRIY